MTKSFMDSWQPPHFREKEQFPWGAVIGGILVIAILVGIGYLVSNIQPTPSVEQSVQSNGRSESTIPPEPEAPVVKLTTADVPPMAEKCDVVAGVIPGSVIMNGNTVKVIFKNNGKKDIEGSYFEFSGETAKAYLKNSDTIKPGELVSYEVNLDTYSLELGIALQTFVILPVQDGKACVNQRMVVIGN